MLHARHGGVSSVLINSSAGKHKCLRREAHCASRERRAGRQGVRHHHGGVDISGKGTDLSQEKAVNFYADDSKYVKSCFVKQFEHRPGIATDEKRIQTETTSSGASAGLFCTAYTPHTSYVSRLTSSVIECASTEHSITTSTQIHCCTVCYYVPCVNSR